MQRYHIDWISQADLPRVNRLLAMGWRPVREQAVGKSTAAGDSSDGLLVVLERDDDFPVFNGEVLCEGVPLSLLNEVSLLQGFSDAELRELVAVAEVKRYDAESVIFDEGQSERRICIVLDGTVSIQLLGLSIDDPVVLEAGPRDAFGETTFFAATTHTTRATAVTIVRTLELSGTAFDDLLQAGRPTASKLALNGAALLAARLQATDAWVREILQEGQSAEFARSWRRFRHSLSTYRTRPSGAGFIRV